MDKKHPTWTKLGHFISVAEAARRLGVNDKTIKRWCASGKLPAIAKPYGKTVTYQISPQALEVMALHLQVRLEKKPLKPSKLHIEYLSAWETAMGRGTLTGKVFSPRTIEIYKLYVEKYLGPIDIRAFLLVLSLFDLFWTETRRQRWPNGMS